MLSEVLNFSLPLSNATIRQANWDIVSNVRKQLHRDIEEHPSSLCTAKLTELKASYEVLFFTHVTSNDFHMHSGAFYKSFT